MFDCVMPTRLGRHGIAYTVEGNIHLSNSKFRSDHSPLCFSLKNNLSKILSINLKHLSTRQFLNLDFKKSNDGLKVSRLI